MIEVENTSGAGSEAVASRSSNTQSRLLYALSVVPIGTIIGWICCQITPPATYASAATMQCLDEWPSVHQLLRYRLIT